MVPRRIIDADGDGVEDNRKVGRNWLDKFEEDVYGYYIDDINNTHNGEIPGHERYGEDPEPKNVWDDIKPAEYYNLQVEEQWKPRTKMAPRRIIDADGDGVEDNRAVSRKWRDKIEADVYGYNIDDINNTQNGELAGHDRYSDFPEPKHHWTTPFDERPKADAAVQFDSLNGVDDLSNNYGDAEMIQTTLSNYVNLINGPEDLELLAFSREFRPFKAKAIYDLDGDGVEDNMKLTSDQLDEFYKPNVFGAEI